MWSATPFRAASLRSSQGRVGEPSGHERRNVSTWPGSSKRRLSGFGRLKRSELMARVRGRANSSTELRMASLLREAGMRGWRRHLPLTGRPDFAWLGERVAVFVDGCFWHGHDCGRNLTPRSNAKLWREKILRNKRRDRRVDRRLRAEGWRVMRVWECLLAQRPISCAIRLRRALKSPRADGTKRGPQSYT